MKKQIEFSVYHKIGEKVWFQLPGNHHPIEGTVNCYRYLEDGQSSYVQYYIEVPGFIGDRFRWVGINHALKQPPACMKCGNGKATHPGNEGMTICSDCYTDECAVALSRSKRNKQPSD